MRYQAWQAVIHYQKVSPFWSEDIKGLISGQNSNFLERAGEDLFGHILTKIYITQKNST